MKGFERGVGPSSGVPANRGKRVACENLSRGGRPYLQVKHAAAPSGRGDSGDPTLRVVLQVFAVAAAYLLGSIDFGVIVARSQGVDIYSVGSGNPGTSNVMRVLGKKFAAIVLLGDGAKGALAALLGSLLVDPSFGYVTLFAAVLGHAFPIWHRFRGGKSVAAAIGGIIYLAPVVGVVLTVVWVAMLLVTKTASVGSLTVLVLMVPLLTLAGRRGSDLVWAAVISVFVIVRHRSNIVSLLSGSERKVVS